MSEAKDEVRDPPHMVAEPDGSGSIGGERDRQPAPVAACDDGSSHTAAPMPVPPSAADSRPGAQLTGARRALKLVLTLQPDGDEHYTAILAVGSDGCDPLLHTMTARGLGEVLDELARLAVTAEAHWRVTPRNVAVAPRRTPPPAQALASSAPAPEEDQRPVEVQPPPDVTAEGRQAGVEEAEQEFANAAPTPREGQLRLFG
jgi:hypothetical protein